jgi:hypothetical protein
LNYIDKFPCVTLASHACFFFTREIFTHPRYPHPPCPSALRVAICGTGSPHPFPSVSPRNDTALSLVLSRYPISLSLACSSSRLASAAARAATDNVGNQCPRQSRAHRRTTRGISALVWAGSQASGIHGRDQCQRKH